MGEFNYYSKKVCVVTGASSGMGKATTKLLVENGAEVYAMDIQPVDVEGIAKFVQVDLSDKASVDQAFTELPEKIDAFFGVAGVLGQNLPFIKVACIDLVSNKYMMEELLPERMNENGAIALVSSGVGVGWEKEGNKKYYVDVVEAEGWDNTVKAIEAKGITAFNGGLAYIYSKLAVNYLVAKMQKFYGLRKVRVNAIMPGGTRTSFGSESGLDVNDSPVDSESGYCGYTGRIADPVEMAKPLLFLNSDLASYVSGAILPVDSGTTSEIAAGIRSNPVGDNLDLVYSAIFQAK